MRPYLVESCLIKFRLIVGLCLAVYMLPELNTSHENIRLEAVSHPVDCTVLEMKIPKDTSLVSKAHCRIRIVPSDHSNVDTGSITFLNGKWYFSTQGILNLDQAQ